MTRLCIFTAVLSGLVAWLYLNRHELAAELEILDRTFGGMDS